MIAICIPTWNRKKFTEECLESFKKFTNFDLVTKVIIYDNNSSDGTLGIVKNSGINYKTGNYPGAWVGFNELFKDIKKVPSIKYIGKVDNDVEFTQPWIEEIIEEFEKRKKLGSIRYGLSSSNGGTHPFESGGYHGGLKIFRKDVVVPIKGKGRCGSNPISDNIQKKNMTMGTLGVGIRMLDKKYPYLAKEYKGEKWQR